MRFAETLRRIDDFFVDDGSETTEGPFVMPREWEEEEEEAETMMELVGRLQAQSQRPIQVDDAYEMSRSPSSTDRPLFIVRVKVCVRMRFKFNTHQSIVDRN